MEKRKANIVLILVIIVAILSSCVEKKDSSKETILFQGENGLWEATYIQWADKHSEIQLSYYGDFVEIRNKSHIEVFYDLGYITGKTSLSRDKTEAPFSENQMRSVMVIPFEVTDLIIQKVDISITLDEESIDIKLQAN